MRDCFSPTAIEFIVETVKPRLDLHGYWSAVIGALSILSALYGTGDFMIMWALAVAKIAAVAMMVDRRDMVLMVEVMISYNDSKF